jgi:hypothetical protein
VRIIYTKEEKEKQRENGAVGGLLAAKRMSKKARSARARKAAVARWRGTRKEEVTQ